MHTHTKTFVAAVVVAIVAGGVGYSVGKLSQPSIPSQGNVQNGMQSNRGGFRGGFGTGGGLVTGEVLSKDAESITLKLRDGSSRIVFFASSTQVMRAATGTLDDVAVGSQVSVGGSQNLDGSLTAQFIQLRPVGFIPRQSQGR